MPSRFATWRAAKASRAIGLRFRVALVEKVPLLAGLSQKEYGQLAHTVHEIEVPAGERLLTAGEPGGELFVIIDGEATVTNNKGRTTVLKAGDYFGEMSLIDGAPRSATVDASAPIRLLVLGQRDFWRVLDGAPSIARKIMQTLSHRVRAAEHSSPETPDRTASA
ncbi:MAG TPA: cyclic nucleotide-binding domain-containing protein [bacterium]|nr:cyclic nucleotide-binding domain-containing protein [bacterium]